MDRFKHAAEAFADLCQVMAKLRAPGGCAWDREQTLQTLKPYLIEEAYETLQAIEQEDAAGLCEELGDVLLQVVFQAEIMTETNQFTIAEVVESLTNKLVRRHPHVFGDERAQDATAALGRWEATKAQERGHQGGILDGVPRALPGLLRALRSTEKAAAVGFDWPDTAGPRAKVEEEWQELLESLQRPESRDRQRHELGDMFFALVNLSRHMKLDPEECLRLATDRFHQRFQYIENEIASQGRALKQASMDEMDALWEQAKQQEGSSGNHQ